MAERPVAVVDGSNVAHEETTHDGKPKLANILAVRHAMEARGYHVIVIVDAALYHTIDDPEQLNSLIDRQVIRQAPAGTDADFFVLATADDEHGIVVSNDRYQPYQERFPWIRGRRQPFMIVEGEVEVYENLDPIENQHEHEHGAHTGSR